MFKKATVKAAQGYSYMFAAFSLVLALAGLGDEALLVLGTAIFCSYWGPSLAETIRIEDHRKRFFKK